METNTGELESQKKTCIFVHFRKEFDHIGVRSTSQKLVAIYSADGFQYVRVDDKRAAMKSINRGVPQGSILGPLLFFIYFEDLGEDGNCQSEIIKHADDTVLIKRLVHESEDGKLLKCWVSRNSVDCNYMKTKFTVFEKRSTKYSNIVIGDQEISLCENYNFWGPHFDEKMKFVTYIIKSVSKLAQHCSTL